MSPARKKTPDPPEFPLTLRTLRLALAGRFGRPYTQVQLAKKAKLHQGSVSNIERGSQPASQFLLFRLSEVYEIDLATVRAAYAGTRAKLDDRSEARNVESHISKKPRRRS